MDFISIDDKNQNQPSQKKKGNKNLNKAILSNPSKSKNGAKRLRQRAGGIIYVGHIPHGFYEDEMKAYFNQFGKVIATAVSRSKKTGRSRGYGFVQFQDEDVAKIAAETMNNYLMFNKIVKCRYIPPEERNKDVFEGTISESNFPRQANRKTELKRKMGSLSRMSQSAYLGRVQKKINEFKKFFEKKGIDFNLKINDEIKQDDNKSKKECTKSSSNPDENSGNDSDNSNGVLEIDESENEISFKTPPHVKKVFKKSLNSSTVCQKDIPSNNLLVKKVKKRSKSKRIQKQEKSKEKSEVSLLKRSQKIKEARESFENSKRKESLRSNVKNRQMEKSISKGNTDTVLRKKKQRSNSGILKSKKDKRKKSM